jgi:hypothetical protein
MQLRAGAWCWHSARHYIKGIVKRFNDKTHAHRREDGRQAFQSRVAFARQDAMPRGRV